MRNLQSSVNKHAKVASIVGLTVFSRTVEGSLCVEVLPLGSWYVGVSQTPCTDYLCISVTRFNDARNTCKQRECSVHDAHMHASEHENPQFATLC